MVKSLLLWHKRLALVATVPFIIWALSGLIHPFMSHFTKAERINATPIKLDLAKIAGSVPLKKILNDNQITAFSHATVVEYRQGYFYQITRNVSGEQISQYYALATGKLSHQLTNSVYAHYLADKWSGNANAEVTKVTEFDVAYGKINRILPVYRVELNNKNLLYIDTLGKRVAAHNTPLRESLSYWFRVLHTFSFLGDTYDAKRIVPMLVISACLFLMALFGLVAYVFLWRRIKDKRYSKQRLHRTMGLGLSLCLLGFSSSSLHILIDKFYPETFREIVPGNSLQTATINHDPISNVILAQGDNVALVNIDGQVVSQVVHYEKRTPRFSYWQNGKTDLSDLDVATTVLSRHVAVNGAVDSWQKIEKFGPTYGFVNKRLPVIQLTFTDNPTRYSVEVHTGFTSAIDTRWQQARSWHFGYLHKYHFLNPLGKGVRDSLLTVICLSLVTTAGFGIALYLSRRKRRSVSIKRRDVSKQFQFSK